MAQKTKAPKATTRSSKPSRDYEPMDVRIWADKHIAAGNKLDLPRPKAGKWVQTKSKLPNALKDGYRAAHGRGVGSKLKGEDRKQTNVIRTSWN
jgi:hypothetical protein